MCIWDTISLPAWEVWKPDNRNHSATRISQTFSEHGNLICDFIYMFQRLGHAQNVLCVFKGFKMRPFQRDVSFWEHEKVNWREIRMVDIPALVFFLCYVSVLPKTLSWKEHCHDEQAIYTIKYLNFSMNQLPWRFQNFDAEYLVGCFFQGNKFIMDCSLDIKMQLRRVLNINFGITFFLSRSTWRWWGVSYWKTHLIISQKCRLDKLILNECLI